GGRCRPASRRRDPGGSHRVSGRSCRAFLSGTSLLCASSLQEGGESTSPVGEQPTDLVHPTLETLSGSGDPEGGDDVAVAAPDRYGDTAETDLELVDRDRPAPSPRLRELLLEGDAVGGGLRRQPLQPPAWHREGRVGVQHLAESGGVRRH